MFLLAGAIAAGLTILTHTAPFAFLLESTRRGDSMWHVPADPASPAVYLTYDDGPNPSATPLLLDVLQREGTHATFFLIDDHVTADTAPIVRRIFEDGHAVGLHSNERWLMLRRPEEIAAALVSAAGRIEGLGGARPCALFRPHGGWRSAAMYAALDSMGYRLTGWSFGLWDWNWGRARDPVALAGRLAAGANAGDIIVIHDGHHLNPRADRQYAVDATARLIPALRARGLAPQRLPCP